MQITYTKPPQIAKPTMHLKWKDGALYQLWHLTNCYGTTNEWRKVEIEIVD